MLKYIVGHDQTEMIVRPWQAFQGFHKRFQLLDSAFSTVQAFGVQLDTDDTPEPFSKARSQDYQTDLLNRDTVRSEKSFG